MIRPFREQSGGAFLKYLQRSTIANEEFVCSRSGEARRIIQGFQDRAPQWIPGGRRGANPLGAYLEDGQVFYVRQFSG